MPSASRHLINMPRYVDGPDRQELRFVDVPTTWDYEMHPRPCCDSCLQDVAEGYGEDIEGCCCRAIPPVTS